MRVERAVLSAALLSVISCGGSSTGPDSGSNSCATPLSATVNGVAWCSPLPQAVVSKSIVSIAGFDTGITSSVAFAFAATAPGTYSLTFGTSGAGSGTYVRGGQGWSSGLAGGTGSVTITTLTSNHLVGTFAFDAVPSNGGATGTIHVANGKFDMSY